MANLATGATLKLNTTTVSEITNISGLGYNSDVLDDTTHNRPSRLRSCLKGLTDQGEVKIDGFVKYSDLRFFERAARTTSMYSATITIPTTPDITQWDANVYITSLEYQAPKDGLLEYSATIKIVDNEIFEEEVVYDDMLRPNTIVIFGTSITYMNGKLMNDSDYTNTGVIYYHTRGYFARANVMLGHRLKLLYKAGVGGNTLAQMLARIETDVLAYNPGWCIVEGGTNDIAGDNLAVMKENATTIFELLQDEGINVIACTIPPTTIASNAAKKLCMNSYNAWLKTYCQSNGIILCDWHKYLIDPSTGDPATGITYDGVHFTPLGGGLMGKAMYLALKDNIPEIDMLPDNNTDTNNLCTNSLCLGDTVGVATGFTTAGGASYTASKVSRTDEILGEWQQFAVYGAGEVNMSWTVGTDSFTAGETVYGACEFQADNDVSSDDLVHHDLYVTAIDAGYNSLLTTLDNTRFSAEESNSYTISSGVFRTPDMVIPATSRYLQISARFNGLGTVRFSRFDLRKVT